MIILKNSDMSNISLLIINRNYSNYIKEALDSILNQSKLPKEIVIIDDYSTDSSFSKYIELQNYIYGNNLNIDLIVTYNSSRKGVIACRNIAVNHSSCDYLCFLDADDYISTTYLEDTSRILDNNQEIGIVYTDFILFDQFAPPRYYDVPQEEKGGEIQKGYFKRMFPEFNEESKKLLQNRNFIHGGSLFRRKCFEDISGYIKSDIPEDYSLYKRIVNFGWNAKKCNTCLLFYRQHSNKQFNITGE